MTPNTAVIAGTAMYRERMALPEGAMFEASLIDVSRADGAADVVGDVRFAAPSGLPIRFSIPYDPGRIDAAHRYGVRARILLQEKLLFTTDTHYPVLTQGAPETVDVLLRRVTASAAASTSPTKRAVMRGLYAYTADTGWFLECRSGRRLTVAQEGDNAALEAAYVQASHAQSAAMFAVVEGRIEERVPMEGAARPMLVVDRFVSIQPGNCEDGSSASLENTYWKVVQIRGAPVTVGERQREPHLILHPDTHRVTGNGGCNSLTGSYAVDGDRITFTRMAGTMMACMEGMEQEHALHQALGTIAHWRIAGQKLELLDGQGTVVLGLESRYLN